MLKLKVSQIRTDGGTQMRVGPRNQDAVREYADVLKEGGHLPPVTVFFDGRDYWLADGFHRHSAHLFLSLPDIEADVREGSKRDAILHAVGANASHGLRRTNADKRRAVEALLKDEEWGSWSDREIARASHTSHPFVAKARQDLTGNISSERTFNTKHGTQATMQIANIGQRPATLISNKVIDAPARQPTVDAAQTQDLLPPPRPQEPALHANASEPVIKVEDLYIPFADPTPPAMDPVEAERRIKALHNSLERLLKEKDGRYLLSQPDPYTRSVRALAHHLRDALDDWLDESSEQATRTITIDALN